MSEPGPSPASLKRWETAGLVALAVIVIAIPASLLRPARVFVSSPIPSSKPAFTGSASCKDCHKAAYGKWVGSDHERAMDVATEKTVLGDFDNVVFTYRGVSSRFFKQGSKFLVETEGPDGKPGTFQISHVFGIRPLQQYLVPFPGGRLQCLMVAWDTVNRKWFRLYPDMDIPAGDWMHWTRNAQNWNGMCAECHSTNLKKGYDAATETFNTTWSEISVGCEACHGPGSKHVAWANLPPMARPQIENLGLVVRTSGITSAQLVEQCAPCHSRRAELGDYDHTGGLLLDQMLPSLLTEGLYYPDGQQLDEVYTYQSFLQSKMYARGVKCTNCHDPHTARLVKTGNELCAQCHQPAVFDTPEHHFHKKEWQGKPSAGSFCVKCHMPETAYMVVDYRADHSFQRPRPDLTAEIGTPNACGQAGCHADKPLSWQTDAYRKWYGLARRPHFAGTFAAARAGKPQAMPELLRIVNNSLQPAIVRATALTYLERNPGPQVTAALRAGILSEDPVIRHVAASGLRLPDPKERVSILGPLLFDPVRAVRLDAVSALAGVPKELFKPYQREAFEKGVAEYREVMEYSLDFSSSGMNLGNLYTGLGQAVEAEKAYRQALKVDDLFFPAKMNLAVLLSGQGRNAEAETLLREVLAAYPDNHEAAYSLGLLLVEVGKPEEAVDLLRRAASGMPGNGRVRYNLGLLLGQLGRSAEAGDSLRAAVAIEPENPAFLEALAAAETRQGSRERP